MTRVLHVSALDLPRAEVSMVGARLLDPELH